MCDCLTQINEQLKTYNTAVDVSINLTSGVPAKALIKTYKQDESKRQKAMTLIASYCPFCGKKYEDAEAVLEATATPNADGGGV